MRGRTFASTSFFNIFLCRLFFHPSPPTLLGIRVRSLHRQKSILCRVRTRWSSRRHCLYLHTPLIFFSLGFFFFTGSFSPRSQLVSFVNGRNQLLLRWGSCVQNSQQFYNFSFPRERWRWSDTIGNLINRKRRFIFHTERIIRIQIYTGSNKDLKILNYIFKFQIYI